MRQPCTAPRRDGGACRVPATPGRVYCRYHDPSPDARAKHREESRRGGKVGFRFVESLEPLASVMDVEALDLESAAGIRTLIAGALRHLSRLRYTTVVANSIGQLAVCARGVIEMNLEERISALERNQEPWRG